MEVSRNRENKKKIFDPPPSTHQLQAKLISKIIKEPKNA